MGTLPLKSASERQAAIDRERRNVRDIEVAPPRSTRWAWLASRWRFSQATPSRSLPPLASKKAVLGYLGTGRLVVGAG